MALIAFCYGALAFVDLIKAELLPAKYQDYTLVKGIPSWSWRTWALGFLVIILLVLLEGAHDATRKREQQITDRKHEIEQLEAQLIVEKDRFKPQFRFKTINFGVFPSQPNVPQVKGIDAFGWFELRLLNSGVPSIATNWRVFIEIGGHQIEGRSILITDAMVITMRNEKSEKIAELTKDSFIQGKTIKSIPTGDQARGWIVAGFTGHTALELRDPKTKWIVTCEDVLGKEWKFEHYANPNRAAEGLAFEP